MRHSVRKVAKSSLAVELRNESRIDDVQDPLPVLHVQGTVSPSSSELFECWAIRVSGLRFDELDIVPGDNEANRILVRKSGAVVLEEVGPSDG